ncbi:hypothetical protein Tco_0419532, partial [Tanacetum coccineum]
MASFDYRLNSLYTIKECSSCGALYTTNYCCSKGGLVDKIVRDPNKTPDSSQRPPQNCARCGNPVDGPYCRGCALLRKKFKEDLFTYSVEDVIFPDLQPCNNQTISEPLQNLQSLQQQKLFGTCQQCGCNEYNG